MLEGPAADPVPLADRLLPTGLDLVDGPPDDFREAREVGRSVRLDTAYRGLRADEDGKWRVHVDLPNGTHHTVWGEVEAFPWLQVFTGKAEARTHAARRRGRADDVPTRCIQLGGVADPAGARSVVDRHLGDLDLVLTRGPVANAVDRRRDDPLDAER